MAKKKTKTNYIDGQRFTALFKQRWKNYNEICEMMNTLVQHIGTKHEVVFRRREDKVDAIASTVLYCIERIDRFKNGIGFTAFNYYSRISFKNISDLAIVANKKPTVSINGMDDEDIDEAEE